MRDDRVYRLVINSSPVERFVTGMAGNATFGSYRMGPVFGGMLFSGERVAQLVDEKLKEESKIRSDNLLSKNRPLATL